MVYDTAEALPQEVQELPSEARNIFMTAVNAAASDGLNEADAHQVGWNSVHNIYAQDESGEWYVKAERRMNPNPAGTMPNS